MSQHAYLVSTSDAARHLTSAIAEAVALLPEEHRTKHWVAAHTAPNAWDAVRCWYDTQEHSDPELAAVLTHLVSLSTALRCLKIALAPIPTTAPDLRLPKVRRRYP